MNKTQLKKAISEWNEDHYFQSEKYGFADHPLSKSQIRALSGMLSIRFPEIEENKFHHDDTISLLETFISGIEATLKPLKNLLSKVKGETTEKRCLYRHSYHDLKCTVPGNHFNRCYFVRTKSKFFKRCKFFKKGQIEEV